MHHPHILWPPPQSVMVFTSVGDGSLTAETSSSPRGCLSPSVVPLGRFGSRVLEHLEDYSHNIKKSLHFLGTTHVLGTEKLSRTILHHFSEVPCELGGIMISIFPEVVTEFQRCQVTCPQ